MRSPSETAWIQDVSIRQSSVESKQFEWMIAALIFVNAIIIGLETSQTIKQKFGAPVIYTDGQCKKER